MSTDDKGLLFGAYSITVARGRWIGTCYRCGHKTKPRPSVGLAEASVRGHIADVHHADPAPRDIRETHWRSAT